MNRFEQPLDSEFHPELQQVEDGHEITSSYYRLRVADGSPYLDLFDAEGTHWMKIFRGSTLATSETTDVTHALEPPRFETDADGNIVVRIASRSQTGKLKEQTWVCRNDYIETFVAAETSGALQSVSLLGGTYVAPNMFGEYMSERYFNSIYNPQPSEMERPIFSALESTKITTSGRWKPGQRREFLLAPFVYGFNVSPPGEDDTPPGGEWLMASISAPIEEQNMVDFRYDVHEDGFLLRLTYDSTEIKTPTFTSPSLLLHFAPSPEQGLADAKSHWEELGHLSTASWAERPDWHSSTKLALWGHQLEYALRQPEAKDEQSTLAIARKMSSEAFVTEALESLSKRGITVDTLVIDDKWQEFFGTNTPDRTKWPDMARFVRTQREIGRHVMLWLKLFDPEGLPPELCIVDSDGRPIASDPTNPDYLALVWEQARHLTSPQALDADGLKPDFVLALPYGQDLIWHGNERGPAALHRLFEVIHDGATSDKKDALVQAQIVHPWFADVISQVRLNDTNERRSVTRSMGRRATLAGKFLPGHTIDPDGWPMDDIEMFREYIQIQPEIAGAVTLHYVDTVKGAPLTEEDFGLIRTAIRQTKE